jgi:hypothetical protein
MISGFKGAKAESTSRLVWFRKVKLKCSHLMGYTWVFGKLVLRPLASTNKDRIAVVTCRSWLEGLMKTAASFA